MNRWACLALLLVGSTAHADSFQKLYDDGQDAFNLGEHDRARELFLKARKLDKSKPGPHRWLGRLARIREEWDECIASTTTALRLRPDSPLRAEVKADLDACRAALGRPAYDKPLAPGQGALAVLADVEGAAVTVDKIGKGATPVPPVPLNKGRRVVELRREGYRDARVEVDVIPGIVVDVIVKLDPR